MVGYPRYLTDTGIARIVKRARRNLAEDLIDRAYDLSIGCLLHIFGEDWVDRNIADVSAHSHPTSLLNSEQDRKILDRHKDDVISMCGLILFGQSVKNVRPIISRIFLGEVEAGLFEIEVSRILFNQGLKFDVKVPTGTFGEDYDFEIFLPDGTTVAADAKCKLSSTSARDSSVINSLESARKQLPKNRAGVIFVSYPEIWVDENTLKEITPFLVDRFLKKTSRIHVVVVVIKFRTVESHLITSGMIYHVITNPSITACMLKDPFKDLNDTPKLVPNVWSLASGMGLHSPFPAIRWIDPKSF